MTERTRVIVFGLTSATLAIVAMMSVVRGDAATAAAAIAGIVALFVRPPRMRTVSAGMALAVLALTGCEANYKFLGFRASSIEMTPQASNPVPSGVGGIYTKNSDNLPRFVDTSGNEYRAGDAKHVVISAGTPGGSVLGDCWIDSSDGNRLYCKEDAGDLPQRTDLNAPGPIGAGTPSTGTFSSITIGGAPAEAVFARTCTLTSAAAATPVNCLSDVDVPSTKKAYLLGWHAKINGATPWATTATCSITDTASIGFISIAVAAMTGNAFIADHSANVTQADAYARNLGGTASDGLQIVCNANGSGSDLVVTAYGVVK